MRSRSQSSLPRPRGAATQSGFTLIELLVVITILGVLAAIVVFAVRGLSDKGKTESTAADSHILRTAEEAYCAKNGRYASMTELVDARLLTGPSGIHRVTPGAGGRCGTGPSSSFALSTIETGLVATVPTDDLGVQANQVAVNPQTNRIYATNLGSGTVTVIDGASNQPIATVNVGSNPGVIEVNPTRNRIYVANGDSTVSVIDGDTNSVIATPATTGNVTSMTVNPGNGKVYMASSSRGQVLDPTTNTISLLDNAAGNPLIPAQKTAFVVNPTTNTAYALTNTASFKLLVIDGTTDAVTSFPIQVAGGNETATTSLPKALAINAATNRVYVIGLVRVVSPSGASRSKIWVIDPSGSGSVVGGFTESGATTADALTRSTMAVDESANKVYVPTFQTSTQTNTIAEFDGATNTYTRQASMPATPLATFKSSIVVNPSVNRAYVGLQGGGSSPGGVTVLDGDTMLSTNVLPGVLVASMAVNTTTNRVYVVDANSNTIKVLE